MKPFNLDEYHKNPSRKLITRDGRTVRRILCTDARGGYPVIALIDCGDYDSAFSYTKEGKHIEYKSSSSDLFFAPEKHEGWINIFKNVYNNYIGQSRIFESKEDAEKDGEQKSAYIATVKIEWEE